MLMITLSGILLDTPKMNTDSNGNKYLSWLCGTEEPDNKGHKNREIFRCYYGLISDPQVVGLKKGDIVMLAGNFRTKDSEGNNDLEIRVLRLSSLR